MNDENLKRWTHELRTTKRPQAREQLAARKSDGSYAYCCLGIGERLVGRSPGSMTHEGCPSTSFVKWLGVDVPSIEVYNEEMGHDPDEADYRTWDLELDWPAELSPRDFGFDAVTAVHLNDTMHLTFPQIADCVDYFGIKEAVPE